MTAVTVDGAVALDAADPFGWLRSAACRGLDPDLFHPVKTEHGMTAIARAKAVCVGCPVRAECLGYALVNCERLGVWGGMSERERRTLRGQRRRSAA